MASGMRRWFAALVVVLVSVGCAKPRIDAKTSETLKQSLQKVRDSLSVKRRAEFDGAIGTIYSSQISFDTLARGFSGITSIGANLQAALDGKTADEVIAYAEKLKKEHPSGPFDQLLAAKMGGVLNPQIVTPDRLKANILGMMRSGIGSDVIVRYVRSVSLPTPLTAEPIIDWKSSGIPDSVLAAAVGRSSLP
jgi:hypothetical protein